MLCNLFYRQTIFRNLKFAIFFAAIFFIYTLLSNTRAENFPYLSHTCTLLKNGDREEIDKFINETIPEDQSELQIEDCDRFVEARNYFGYPISQEERENPLAFSIIVYKSSKQVEKLLRAIYRTSNVYCIHVDKKSAKSFRDSIDRLASCLDNVVVISNRDVQWGTISTIESELDCMKILHEWREIDWKYLINLTGQEFPLKSNRELVRITEALNGANWISAHVRLPEERFGEQRENIPFGLSMFKGPTHGVFSRGFVRFIFENETTRTILSWLEKTDVPDESFFQALNFNSQILRVPGAYSGNVDDFLQMERMGNRYKQWYPDLCNGFYVRLVCVLSVADLEHMFRSRALFANKFYFWYNPMALECLDEYVEAKSYGMGEDVDEEYLEFYRNLELVKHHI